jgi:hypothetical protein
MKKFLVKISYTTDGSYGDYDKKVEEDVVAFDEDDLENIHTIRQRIEGWFNCSPRFSIDNFFYLGEDNGQN